MKNLLLLFILSFFNTVFGQQYSCFWYNSENGLPQNSVKDITKDRYGFLWLATEGGIVRYDGYKFLTYPDLKLSNLNFYYFQGDISKDRIFNNNIEEQQYVLIKNRKIITNTRAEAKGYEKFFRFKKKDFYNVNNSNLAYYIEHAFCIKIKTCAYYFEEDFITYTKENLHKNISIKLPFKPKNFKNIFTKGDAIFIYNPEKKNFVAIENGKFSQVDADPLYNDPDSKIFWQQSNDQVFIINHGKVYLSEYANGKMNLRFIVHIKNKEIDFGTLSCVFYDKEYKNLYLGTFNNGLGIIKISSFQIPNTEIPLENRIYYTALPFSNSSIINTQGRVFDQNTLIKDFNFNKIDNLFSIAYDNSGNIIYPKNKYVYRRFKNSGYEKEDSILIGDIVMGIFAEKDMYTLSLRKTRPYLLNIYTNDSFENPECTLSFPASVNMVRVLNKYQLMIGRTDGLFLYSISKKTLLKISSLNIKNIVSTSDGNFWIISRGEGFYLMKNNKLIKMPYDENGYISSPHNVLEDQKGFLWIPTNNGLFKVLKNKLLEYAKDPKTDIFYYRYSKKEGFNTNEFNGTGTLANTAVLNNGQFVLPSMDGFIFFDPLKTPSYYPKPQNIYIERAKSKGSDIIYFQDILHLENDFGIATIYVDIPYYSSNDNLYIETSLRKGNEPAKWQRLKNKEYTLNNLSPGNYTLNVRVLISPDGKFAYKKIFITIPALFYQTLWFRVLASVAFLGLILFIILLRTKILTTQNNELKKIVHQKNDELKTTQDKLKNESKYQQNLIQTINHDITTPIKYLSAMSQKLSETDNPKLQKQYFNTIYKSSEELYKFTLNLKNYTELFNNESKAFQEDYYSIFELLEIKKNLFEEIAFQKNTKIINNSSKSIKLNFNESIMSAVIHNLLDNAVKNTFGGEIIMDAKTEEKVTAISISDSGTGMSDEMSAYYNNLINNVENKPSSFKDQGLGLHLVIQLLKKIDGKIVFRTNTPKGTKVEIIIQNQS